MSSIDCLLTQKCLLARYESTGARGVATYGEPLEINCWIEQREDMIRNTNGEHRVTRTIIYSVEPLNLRDRVWAPGDYTDAASAKKENSVEIQSPMHRIDPCGCDSHYEATLS